MNINVENILNHNKSILYWIEIRNHIMKKKKYTSVSKIRLDVWKKNILLIL